MVKPVAVPIHFLLGRWTHVRHWDVVCTRPDISDRTILWRVLRACEGVGRATSGSTGLT